MDRPRATRRAFLENLAVGGVAATAFASLETARGFAANDTLTVGCLGTGGRCQALMKSLAQVPGVKIAAVCDIYDAHLERGEGWRIPRPSPPSTIARSSTARTSTPS